MLRRLLYKISGRKDTDKSIPTRMVMEQVCSYAWCFIRGTVKGIGCNRSGRLFVGKRVKIQGKKNCFFSKNVRIGDDSFISGYSVQGICIGKDSKLGEKSIIRCSNIQHLGQGLRIGDRSSFDGETFFGASGCITVGNDVIAGRNIKFHAENHIFSDGEVLIREQGVSSIGICVGNNCWIGSNVTFLDGAVVGNGCVIAAGSVVNSQFPDNVVIGGIPAKVIKKRV